MGAPSRGCVPPASVMVGLVPGLGVGLFSHLSCCPKHCAPGQGSNGAQSEVLSSPSHLCSRGRAALL